jgi:putative effector of murein hydrolase
MDDPSPLLPHNGELVLTALLSTIVLVVAVASYRRSRWLSNHPIWKSVVIGVVAGAFWELWLIVWWVNRERVAQQWREYRQTQPAPVAGQS